MLDPWHYPKSRLPVLLDFNIYLFLFVSLSLRLLFSLSSSSGQCSAAVFAAATSPLRRCALPKRKGAQSPLKLEPHSPGTCETAQLCLQH